MPDAAPAPAAAAGGQQQPQQSSFLATILRMAFMWWLMSWFRGGQNNTVKEAAKDPYKFTTPIFTKGEPVDFYLFIAEQPYVSGGYNMRDLIWSETGVALATKDLRNISYLYEPSKAVQNNGSLYLHALFARAGHPISPSDPDYDENTVFGGVFNLITYLPKPKNSTGVNLLAGEKPKEPVKDEGPPEIISFLKPNLSIQVVDHFQTYNKAQVPPQVAPFLTYNEEAKHFPIIWFNDFWLLRDYLVPMNETVTNVTLHLDLGFASLTWWTLLNQMEKTFETQRGMGLQQEGESDELKRVFLEGNPVLLAVTMVVSLLHTVFDMLAFKNDIGFWKNNKSMEGLSARSILINAFCQLVILLYLLDNETSYVVLFSSFIGTAIEFWKVTKAMKVSVDWTRFPYLKVEDRASYSKSQTKQHDEVAMRYLSYVLYPLVIGYAIYSLMYKTHKSWYSWILSSLVGAVYMFGFILMCPQLYLNYKLKSVAHLPWRQMTYKFLNTIIDDLFAFVIKMPLLHRLSVFRDDVVFLVYLYQRWIYRVDMKRVNEFGWAGEADPSEEQSNQAQIAATGTAGTDAGSALPAGESTGEAAGKRPPKRKDAQAESSAAKTGAADTAASAAEAAQSEKKKNK